MKGSALIKTGDFDLGCGRAKGRGSGEGEIVWIEVEGVVRGEEED